MDKAVHHNLVWQPALVSREEKEQISKQKSKVLWFTGLSGSGKSTLAYAIESYLHKRGFLSIVLDGDNVRHGLCSDLGFSNADRQENIRRVGEVSRLFLDTGVIVLTAFISPFNEDRLKVRNSFESGDFLEIYCHSPMTVCEERDVKGLYKKARLNLVKNFTGLDSLYEEPTNPDIYLDTARSSIDDCVNIIISHLDKTLDVGSQKRLRG